MTGRFFRLRTLRQLATLVGWVVVWALSPVHADESNRSESLILDLLITNAQIFDGRDALAGGPYQVHIQGQKIIDITATDSPVDAKQHIDAEGRWLIPGLIDAHVHPSIPLGFLALRDADPNYIAYRSAVTAEQMLRRGFTTVRDMGGPSFGLKRAIDEGLILGPRIFPSGAMVSQTSGHGDFRSPGAGDASGRDVMEQRGYGAIADGGSAVLAAVRSQLRQGASQIKVAAGGGLSSSYDPLDSVQYRADELRAAVQAAEDFGTYVAVHAYTPTAIRRSIEAGVKSIEHAHLIDEPTIKLMAERGVFLSPQAYLFSGAAFPLTGKAQGIAAGLDQMMRWAKQYDLPVAFGTDVFGSPRIYGLQANEFSIRLRWFSALEVLRQATSGNARLLALSGMRHPYREGKLGVIEPGAWADVLLLDDNPLDDITLLENAEQHIPLIIKNGEIIKNTLK
ncbi:MAG: amidohydrolase family protein [Steroidobacteraceae bacterium]